MHKKFIQTRALFIVIATLALGVVDPCSANGLPKKLFETIRKGVAARLPHDGAQMVHSPAPKTFRTSRHLPLATAVAFGTVAVGAAFCDPKKSYEEIRQIVAARMPHKGYDYVKTQSGHEAFRMQCRECGDEIVARHGVRFNPKSHEPLCLVYQDRIVEEAKRSYDRQG